MAVRLVAFDLDGTLVRGETVCEAIAQPLGREIRMRELERASSPAALRRARAEMASWYRGMSPAELCRPLASMRLAEGAEDGIAQLRGAGIAVAIASITWSFAVEWFARRLHVDHWVGTALIDDGRIDHMWPSWKPRWVAGLARDLGIDRGDIAAVGDSRGDFPMLRASAMPVFVGADPPPISGLIHLPNASIVDIAARLVAPPSPSTSQPRTIL